MLQSNYHLYDRPHPDASSFHDLAGGLIFFPNGARWKEARTLFEAYFTTPAIRALGPMLQDHVDTLLMKCVKLGVWY